MKDDAQKVIEEVSRNYENELIKKIQKTGDRDAFFYLVKLYDARIYSVVYRYLRHREDALELSQDVFVQAYKKIKQYRWEAPFYFWLQRIAVNYSINRMKKYGKDIISRSFEIEGANAAETAAQSPEKELEEEEHKKFVDEALAKVSEPYRLPVILKDIEGFSYEEIVKLTGVNIGTVKSRISRGREELKSIFLQKKERLKEYGM